MGLTRNRAAPREHANQPRRDCAALQQQLSHADAVSRRWAARDLAAWGGAGADALIARLAIEPDLSVREVIFTTLTRVADAAVTAAMVELLRSPDCALRNEAVLAMKNMPQQMAGIMPSLLCDRDSGVRLYAVTILESLCHPKVELWLCAVLEQDLDVNVCGGALDLLAELATEASRESLALVKTRFPDEAYIAFAADLAIKRLGQDGPP
jgi:HEAT repeat protein